MDLRSGCASIMSSINSCYKALQVESKACQAAESDVVYAFHAGKCNVLSEELITLVNLLHQGYGFNTLFEADINEILSDAILLIQLKKAN